MKNALKLFKLIFMIVVYIHVLACLWFVIASSDAYWWPTVDYVREDGSDLYESPLIHQYCISIYSAVLLLTGNDIIPRGTFQIAFVAIFITIGAIINANIFGNMALIISDLNKKSAEFQTQIDTANTAMKNMHLPQHLQTEVISYLNYIQQTLDHQNELIEFFDKISPSLKEEVTRFVFKGILVQNKIFQSNESAQDYMIQMVKLIMDPPEETLISQGEWTSEFYIIAKGECECFVKDERTKLDRFVRTLNPGQHFGEIALLTEKERTATIKTKNYSTIGQISKEHFHELCLLFPEIKKKFLEGLHLYCDKNKQWQKSLLKNIGYFKDLSSQSLDELVYKLKLEAFEEGQVIFKIGEKIEKIYILADGLVNTYMQLNDEDLVLDSLQIPGSTLGQYSFLKKSPLTYSARAAQATNLLVLHTDQINKMRAQLPELDMAINSFSEEIVVKGMPMLDYVIFRKPAGDCLEDEYDRM